MIGLSKFYIPKAPGIFAGRKKLLEAFKKAFFHYRLMVVDGICGIGKTSFALQFASQMEENEEYIEMDFLKGWLECEDGPGLEGLLYEINLFLKACGETEFDTYLKSYEPDLEGTVRALSHVLNKKNYLLFIDSFDRIPADEALLFLKILGKFLKKSRLIVISSKRPLLAPLEWLEVYELNVKYLDRKEAFYMIKESLRFYSFSPLKEKELQDVYKWSGGHPFLLKTFLGMLLTGDRTVNELIKDFSQSDRSSKDYIFNNLLNGLSEEEKDFLINLSVFRKPVKRDGLLCICPHNSDKITEKLKERFLLELDREKRYFIPGLLRDFCYGKKDQKENHVRCAIYYNSSGGKDDNGRLEKGREAFHHFTMAGEYFKAYEVLTLIIYDMFSFFQLNELEEKIDLILEKVKDVSPALYIYKADLLRIRGRSGEALRVLEENLPSFPEKETGHLLYLLSRIKARLGEWHKALSLAEKSKNILEEKGDRTGVIKSLSHTGSIYRLKGDYKRAMDYYNKCREINSEVENELLDLNINQGIAITMRNQGKAGEALLILEKCLARAEAMNWISLKLTLTNNLAAVFYDLGEFQRAMKLWEDNQEFCLNFGWREALIHSLVGSSLLFEERGEPGRALSQYMQVLKLCKETENSYIQVITLARLSELFIRQGDLVRGKDFNKRAFSLASQYDFSDLLKDIKLNFAEIDFLEGNREKASSYLEELVDDENIYVAARAYRFKYILESDFQFRDKSEELFELLEGSKKRRCLRHFAFLDEMSRRVSPYSSEREYIVKMRDREYDANLDEVEKLRKRKEDFDLFIDGELLLVWEKDKGDVKIVKKKSLFHLLLFFVRRGGEFFSARELYPSVWGGKFVHENDVTTVKMSISRLRKTLEPVPGEPKYIKLSPIRYKRDRKYYFDDGNKYCFIEKMGEE